MPGLRENRSKGSVIPRMPPQRVAAMLGSVGWTVTTIGLSKVTDPTEHGRAAAAWADYHKRVGDLEADGYRRRQETSRYGWCWTQTLTLADTTVTVRLDAAAEPEARRTFA
jgi:hypothetical protein